MHCCGGGGGELCMLLMCCHSVLLCVGQSGVGSAFELHTVDQCTLWQHAVKQ